jgi:hypothetical protein
VFLSCVPDVASALSVCAMYPQYWATMGTQDTNKYWPGNIGYTRYKQTLVWKHWVHKMQTDRGLAILDTDDNKHTLVWQYWGYMAQTDNGLATSGTPDENRHGLGSIGYTR